MSSSPAPATALQIKEAQAQFTSELLTCEDCRNKAEIVVTPNPLYGTTPNDKAGWIGYYSAECTNCGIPAPGDRYAAGPGAPAPDPVTLEEHRAAMQSAVDEWNR